MRLRPCAPRGRIKVRPFTSAAGGTSLRGALRRHADHSDCREPYGLPLRQSYLWVRCGASACGWTNHYSDRDQSGYPPLWTSGLSHSYPQGTSDKLRATARVMDCAIDNGSPLRTSGNELTCAAAQEE